MPWFEWERKGAKSLLRRPPPCRRAAGGAERCGREGDPRGHPRCGRAGDWLCASRLRRELDPLASKGTNIGVPPARIAPAERALRSCEGQRLRHPTVPCLGQLPTLTSLLCKLNRLEPLISSERADKHLGRSFSQPA